MIKRFVHKVSYHKHPWRHMEFDELSEIYASMTMRSFGFSLMGIFVPIFLYSEGVSIADIMVFYLIFFLIRIPASFVAGKIIGRIGPKHTIAISTFVIIAFLLMLLTYSSFGWPLFMMSIVFSAGNGLFFIAYHTDFSKVQHKKHGGKELGWLFIFERLGSSLGPLIGGFLAAIFAPEVSIFVALLMLSTSFIPLFMSNEPVKTHQEINYASFKVKNYTRSLIALSAFNVFNVSAGILWPLYLGAFIFVDSPYAAVGTVVAISMLVSMFTARMYGKFIDNRKGYYVAKYGITMSAVVNLLRAIVTTGGGAVVLSTLQEPIYLASKLSMVKGLYDEADSLEGMRIVYLVWTEAIVALAKSLLFVVALITLVWFDPMTSIRIIFVFTAAITLLMHTQNFKALKRV